MSFTLLLQQVGKGVCYVLDFYWIPAIGNLYEYSMLEIMTAGLYCPLGIDVSWRRVVSTLIRHLFML